MTCTMNLDQCYLHQQRTTFEPPRYEAMKSATEAVVVPGAVVLEVAEVVGVLSRLLRGGGGVGGLMTPWRIRRHGRVMCSITVGEALDPPAIKNS